MATIIDPTSQVDWAAEWLEYKFNRDGKMIPPDHLENIVRSTLAWQVSYSKHTPALQNVKHFIPFFMIELNTSLGRPPSVNLFCSQPQIQQQPGAPQLNQLALEEAASDESFTADQIVALVLSNRTSITLPQTSPVSDVEPKPDLVGDHEPNDLSTTDHPHQARSISSDDTKLTGRSDELICGNCSRPGHELRDCIGPLDEQGWLAGCPVCNDTLHLYHDCMTRQSLDELSRAEMDQKYLLYYRQNKPPIKCSIDWTVVYNERHPLLIALPWTPTFALKQSQVEALLGEEGKGISWEDYEYEWIGNPDLEARFRIKDSAVDDLANKTLTVSGIRWHTEDESSGWGSYDDSGRA
ncbi:hypothetical protein PG993_002543 [Apiospora rasikravindrae]|uniref:CCHC-type domain-containing protein n=1 Tax=Apiospora rasikravindrae TaxID=990691 RepID=A0ABR1TX64_9PEZI